MVHFPYLGPTRCFSKRRSPFRLAFLAAVCLLAGRSSRSQARAGDEITLRGDHAEISITLRERGGDIVTVPAVVKIYHNGALSGQAAASKGRAFFVVGVGDYTISVSANGYKSVEKEISLAVAVNDEEEILLTRETAPNESSGVPGKPLLAPKANEELERGARELSDNKLEQAEKHLEEAAKLAPNHPDVLYAQGVLYLRKKSFAKAQAVLETASQLDPNNPRTLSALGMAYVDQGQYEKAVPILEHSLQLESTAWDTRWTLAKCYYHRADYEGALKESQEALSGSHGTAPDIELLVAQAQTAVGHYEDAASTLRSYLRNHPKEAGAVTAKRWLDRLTADGKIKQN